MYILNQLALPDNCAERNVTRRILPRSIPGGYLVYATPDLSTVLYAEDTLSAAFTDINNDTSGITAFTVVATGDDADVGETANLTTNKTVTLTSPAGANSILRKGANDRHILLTAGELVLTNITLDGNGFSGGLSITGASLIIEDGAVIRNNVSTGTGVGILVSHGTFLMRGGEIYNNINTSDFGASGGGVYLGTTLTAGEYSGSYGFMEGGKIYGNQNYWGGGVAVGIFSHFTMSGGEIFNNLATNAGGVDVYVRAIFTMNGGSIYNNTAASSSGTTGSGGGVFVGQGTHVAGEPTDWCRFIMNSGSVEGNSCITGGGGVALIYNGQMEMNGGSISNNRTSSAGGGVLLRIVDRTDLTTPMYFKMSGGTVSGNEARFGGGICLYDYDVISFAKEVMLTITGGVITGNTATPQYGGGIVVVRYPTNPDTVTFEIGSPTESETAAPVISGNQAATTGGGIQILNVTLTMYAGMVSGNAAVDNGGGIVVSTGSTLIMPGGSIEGNTSGSNGGGIWVSASGTANLSGATTIINNTATNEGGGIYTADFTDYANLTASDYQNITTANTVVFGGNSASAAYEPPAIASSYTNIGYASTSIVGSGGFLNPINNYDINYVFPPSLLVYAVSYNANGGVGSYPTEYFVEGTEYTVLSPEETGISRPGYTFTGWNTQPNGTGTAYQPGDTFVITEDVNLYAQWEAVAGTVSVLYDSNGGTGSHADVGLPIGTEYTILTPEEIGISRPGYTFVGWNTQPNGTGTAYQPGDTVVLTENLILYAQWVTVLGPYDVLYEANGGTGIFVDTGIPGGTIYTILTPEATVISRPGYVFTGWNTQPDGSGITYQPGNTVTINENLTLYAQWTPMMVAFHVIYNANGGTGGFTDTVLYGTLYDVLSSSEVGITRPGYTFTGWNTQPDGSGTAYQVGDTILITGDVTLYAQWVANEAPVPPVCCIPCCNICCPPCCIPCTNKKTNCHTRVW
ncbi:MAG: InlB B-repeat-containing protein [Oscillospiraceae bacterium]|nr:InlB B-repeat-containing protein [Oscillospiraceae bacterium]